MKYTKLILFRCVRLRLKNIEYFEMNPSEPVQLILGTNGSGKSSIMMELSPLPSEASDYRDGGYKEIHIEHQGNQYILKSVFDSKTGNRHSFYDCSAAVELNDSGKVMYQRELVRQKFGYTQDIHDIVTSTKKFTDMSANERRMWITVFSNCNFDYALELYKKLKERHRDVVGTIRNLKKRLVVETEKIIDTKEQQRLENELSEIHEFVSQILQLRFPVDKPMDALVDSYSRVLQDIAVASKKIIKIKNETDIHSELSIDEIDALISEEKGKQAANLTLIDSLSNDLKLINESIDILKKTNAQSNFELREQIQECELKKSKIESSQRSFKEINLDPLEAIKCLALIEEPLTKACMSLPSNTGGFFSRSTLQQCSSDLSSLKAQKEVLINKLEKLNAQKRHQEAHKASLAIECPKCKYSWNQGYSENEYSDILNSIDKLTAEIKTLDVSIEDNNNKISTINEYSQHYSYIVEIMSRWRKPLEPLWTKVKELNSIIEEPSSIVYLMKLYKETLEADKEWHDHDREAKRLLDLLEMSSKVENKDLTSLIRKASEVEDKIYQLSTQQSSLQESISRWQKYKNNRRIIDTTAAELKILLDKVQVLQKDQVETTRRKIFNEFITQVQTSLAQHEMIVGDIRNQRAIVNDIENELAVHEKDEKALKLLVQQLSPTDGLIAEGLYGFIKVFISRLNAFIKQAWSYPLEIIPCMINESEDASVDLDYKFPISNQSGLKPTPDIGLASKGQMEIINLSFIYEGMNCLGLSDAPLMLDEFGAMLDSKHRSMTTNNIKSMLESNVNRQLFMVSHYDTVYGAFTNAQITVLCDDNIVIPRGSTINSHVVIQ